MKRKKLPPPPPKKPMNPTKLDDIAARMLNAKGKELDALIAEVDAAIGFDTGDSEYDPDADSLWLEGNKS